MDKSTHEARWLLIPVFGMWAVIILAGFFAA
jgi:hypothetical protein